MAAPSSPWDNATFELVKAAFSAFAGATIGALTAGMIAARNKARDDLVKELRAVNLTAAIAYGIADAFLGVKKSNVT